MLYIIAMIICYFHFSSYSVTPLQPIVANCLFVFEAGQTLTGDLPQSKEEEMWLRQQDCSHEPTDRSCRIQVYEA